MCDRRAISVIELILGVIILGLVAALAIPRLSRAAAAPDPGALLRADLKVLRVAIERYHQDHGVYPAQRGDGRHAAGTSAAFVSQLTKFSDEAGHVADSPDAAHRFGPYLRNGLPPCPVPPHAGSTAVWVVDSELWGHVSTPLPFREGSGESGTGWLYHCETGQITPNSDARDLAGRSYTSY